MPARNGGSRIGRRSLLTIVHVNDSHSHLEAVGPKRDSLEGTLGGLAKAAAIIKTLRCEHGELLFLHAGDAFHGDIFFNLYRGVPELSLLKALGLDAMVVGNHEFDLGVQGLVEALRQVGDFPLLAANLDCAAVPELRRWIAPWRLRHVAGLSVGILGLTIPDEPLALARPLSISSDIVGLATRGVAQLRSRGARVVILLSHLGLARDEELAARVAGLDCIVGGHNHLFLERPILVPGPHGRPTPVVQAGEFYRALGCLRLEVSDRGSDLVDYRLIDVGADVAPDPETWAVVAPLKTGVVERYGAVFSTVVGEALTPLSRRFDPRRTERDTALGNLVTDAFKRATGTELAVTVSGLISEDLPAGPLVEADLFRSVSYGHVDERGLGYRLATFRIRGAALIRALESCLAEVERRRELDLQVAGMSFSYDSRRPAGARLIERSLRIGGRACDDARLYSVTVNEGIASLLPRLGVEVEDLTLLSQLELDALRDQVATLRRIDCAPQGRIVDLAAQVER